jgi:hypothetical protein
MEIAEDAMEDGIKDSVEDAEWKEV